MRRMFPALLTTLLATLAACATTARGPATADSSAGLPLLSPASLGESRQVSQLLRAEYTGGSVALRCVVMVDARMLTFIALTSLGQRAFTLDYDGENLRAQRAAQVPAALQSTQLLNDLQLVYWPLQVLQRSWRDSGVTVVESGAGIRELRRDDTLLARVQFGGDPWNGRVRLEHFDWHYTLQIDSGALPAAAQ